MASLPHRACLAMHAAPPAGKAHSESASSEAAIGRHHGDAPSNQTHGCSGAMRRVALQLDDAHHPHLTRCARTHATAARSLAQSASAALACTARRHCATRSPPVAPTKTLGSRHRHRVRQIKPTRPPSTPSARCLASPCEMPQCAGFEINLWMRVRSKRERMTPDKLAEPSSRSWARIKL